MKYIFPNISLTGYRTPLTCYLLLTLPQYLNFLTSFIDWLAMFIFCLCDVVYWISVKIRVNTVQKVKRKNMLPKYAGSFTAEVRTAFLCHHFEVSSPFRRTLRCSSEAINSALDYFRRSQICKYPSN